MNEIYIAMGAGTIVVPWCIWVSASIINHRTEIALMKQGNGHLKEIKEILREQRS